MARRMGIRLAVVQAAGRRSRADADRRAVRISSTTEGNRQCAMRTCWARPQAPLAFATDYATGLRRGSVGLSLVGTSEVRVRDSR